MPTSVGSTICEALTVTLAKLAARVMKSFDGAKVAVIGQATESSLSTSVQILTVWSVDETEGMTIVIKLIGFGVVSKTARLQGSKIVTTKFFVAV